MSYHHGDLRNALVAAGELVLVESGVDALSLREVARRAGVSHAAPYRHFPDKQSLLIEIAINGFRALSSAIDAAVDGSVPEPKARLLAALHAYVTFAAEHPEHLSLMFGPLATLKPPSLESAALAAFSKLVDLTEAALEPHHARTPRARETVALTLWAQAHGLAALAKHVDFTALAPAPTNGSLVTTVLEKVVSATTR